MPQFRLQPFSEHHFSLEKTSITRITRRITQALAAALLGTSAVTAQTPTFTDINASLPPVHGGSALWGDYNRDNALDILLTGATSTFPLADIFENGGSGSFTVISAGLDPLYNSRSAWGDYDSDGDLDLLITGRSATIPFLPTTKLYRNDNGSFTETPTSLVALAGITNGSAKWGDYDNDGDPDLFLTGARLSSTSPRLTTIYRNIGPNSSGSWNFTNINPNPSGGMFVHLDKSDGDFGDYDNDGDLDLIVMGDDGGAIGYRTLLYRNDGGYFTHAQMTAIPNMYGGSVVWGDCNNDGWLDIAIAGSTGNNYLCQIYLNNQHGGFTKSADLSGGMSGSLAWGDYDNDGNLDLLVTGAEPSGNPTSIVYIGAGNGTFSEDTDAHLEAVYDSQGAWGDYDNDGRLDALLSGEGNNGLVSRIYRNTTSSLPNSIPHTPTGVSIVAYSSRSIEVEWNPATDAETPQAALTYNLAVTDRTTGELVMTPIADISTGHRWVAQMGNTNHRRRWRIGGLTPGHSYDICVQTIDGAYASSPFACVTSTVLPGDPPDGMISDRSTDTGEEPTTASIFPGKSPGIYIRNIQDGFIYNTNENPIVGQTNYVYVTIRNNGVADLPHGTVHLYFARSSTSLAWPNDWNAHYVGSVAYGGFIGQAEISSIPANGSLTVEIPWENVPDYGDPAARQFSLLARFTSEADPIAFEETASTYDNASNNNNIAWRSMVTLTESTPEAPVELYNSGDEPIEIELHGFASQETHGVAATDVCQIRVDLGGLFERWFNAGALGSGIAVANDTPEPTDIWITAADAEILGIVLQPGERFTSRVHVIYPSSIPPGLEGEELTWELTQHLAASTSASPAGGVGYLVRMPGGSLQKKGASGDMDLSDLMQVSVQPNPTNAATTISYRLPEQMEVSVEIYDVQGGHVRTLAGGITQQAGVHHIEWDGSNEAGSVVGSGSYFYRIRTASGVAQGRIAITR